MMDALLWCTRLLAFALALQTIEVLRLRRVWCDTGVWRWATLKKDFDGMIAPLRGLFALTLSERGFTILLLFRLAGALALLALGPQGALLALAFFSTWLIAIRWRGTFNGGSDCMTVTVALALWISQWRADDPRLARMCLSYIAVQLTASYFIAGWAKLRSAHWRTGQALPEFFKIPGYDSPPEWVLKLISRPQAAYLAGMSVIFFECLFPLAWTGPVTCAVFLGMAFLFHVFNFWVLGLNRFVWAWLAAYPAIYALSARLTTP